MGRSEIDVNGVTLVGSTRCTRCVVTTTDQATASRGKEPLRTLSRYRRAPELDGKPVFGQNFNPRTFGAIRVGDAVKIL
jgi:hypothetical protein